MAVACAKEPDVEDDVFHAVIDDGTITRTHTDATLKVLWNEDDRITVFRNTCLGSEYGFLGKDGDSEGNFMIIKSGEDTPHDETTLGGFIFATYPHSSDTGTVQDGTVTFSFPEVQIYQGKSFGPGSCFMVAKASAEDRTLKFKNAMGYLSFKLWGDDVHVSSVKLKSCGGELLSGKGTISMATGVPVVTMDKSSSDEIRLGRRCLLRGFSRKYLS